MSNSEIIGVLEGYVQLMELYEENPFKIKSYQSAIRELEKLPYSVAEKIQAGQAYELPFSKTMLERLKEILDTGTIGAYEILKRQTPTGVIEMFQVKGLGPKKIRTLWHQLGINNLSDLLHACYENRLIDVKGFGVKTQTNIRKAIEFLLLSRGKLHIHKAFEWMEFFQRLFEGHRLSPVKDIAFLGNTFDEIAFVVDAPLVTIKERLAISDFLIIEEGSDYVKGKNKELVTCLAFTATTEEFIKKVFQMSSDDAHQALVGFQEDKVYTSVEEIYKGFPYVIQAEHRTHPDCWVYYEQNGGRFIELSDLQGLVHCHTTYSDGKHTIEEMSEACMAMGLSYMVVTDHSQSAFYANGLSPARLEVQWQEINKLNKKYEGRFKIIKGIESDILPDGSLDYEKDVLSQLEVIIASIHSGFPKDEAQATRRLIRAIESPYTHILGHATGRLLLMREGYPVNIPKIIDACAQNHVAIELNSNPYRLDIDYSWLPYAAEKGVKIVITPDAHDVQGIQDLRWGVMLARKAFLTPHEVINTNTYEPFMARLKKCI